MSEDGSTYIGDGVTASFDGWQLRLSTPRESGEHVIYLEPSVYLALRRYAQKVGFEVEMVPPETPTERVLRLRGQGSP